MENEQKTMKEISDSMIKNHNKVMENLEQLTKSIRVIQEKKQDITDFEQQRNDM